MTKDNKSNVATFSGNNTSSNNNSSLHNPHNISEQNSSLINANSAQESFDALAKANEAKAGDLGYGIGRVIANNPIVKAIAGIFGTKNTENPNAEVAGPNRALLQIPNAT